MHRWQISVTTRPGRVDPPRQRIKFEVANVPAHDSRLMPLVRNYDFLPSGYEDILLRVQSREEIMADKIVAFASALKTRPCHRDLWDLQWMVRNGTDLRTDLIKRRVSDYAVVNFPSLVDEAAGCLPRILNFRAFLSEMERFLPESVIEKSFARDGFLDFMQHALNDLFVRSKEPWVDHNPNHSGDFRM